MTARLPKGPRESVLGTREGQMKRYEWICATLRSVGVTSGKRKMIVGALIGKPVYEGITRRETVKKELVRALNYHASLHKKFPGLDSGPCNPLEGCTSFDEATRAHAEYCELIDAGLFLKGGVFGYHDRRNPTAFIPKERTDYGAAIEYLRKKTKSELRFIDIALLVEIEGEKKKIPIREDSLERKGKAIKSAAAEYRKKHRGESRN